MSHFVSVFILFSFLFLSCASTTGNESDSRNDPNELVGSWNLIQYIDHGKAGKDWQSYPSNILYQKHLSGTHFSWIKYDKDNDQLLGMGGGNYEYKDGKYIENIDFFYPPGSSELGQSIPFSMEFKDGQWYHTGYAKNMDIDFETGLMVPKDSTRIEEVWEKTSLAPTENQSLVGTWDLESYRDDLSEAYFQYPDMTGYIKVITPTHFVWTKYDKQGDQIYNAGCGTYSYDGDQYIETIEMMHPGKSGQVGTSITFDINLTNHRWDHFGYGPVLSGDEMIDSLLIDEIWITHLNTLEEENAISMD